MIPDPFSYASAKVEEFLECLAVADVLSDEGKSNDAEQVLRDAIVLGRQFSPILSAYKEQIAAISEGQIRGYAPDGSVHHFVSAHDAVECYWIILSYATGKPEWKLPPSVREWMGIDLSLLTAYIHRERAKGPKVEGEWVGIREAGRRVGVSGTTILEYIKKGKLHDNGLPGNDRKVFVPKGWKSSSAAFG